MKKLQFYFFVSDLCVLYFCFLPLLKWLRSTEQCRTEVVKVKVLAHFRIIGEKRDSYFTIKYGISCRFLDALWSDWESSLLSLVYCEFLIIKDIGFCYILFEHLLSCHMSFFPLILLMWYITLIDFQMPSQPWTHGLNNIILYSLPNLTDNILLRNFASMFMMNIILQFSFLIICLSGLSTGVMLSTSNELGSLYSSIFERVCEGLVLCLAELTDEATWTGVFFVGKF